MEGLVTSGPLFKFTQFDWQINHSKKLGGYRKARQSTGLYSNFHGSIGKPTMEGQATDEPQRPIHQRAQQTPRISGTMTPIDLPTHDPTSSEDLNAPEYAAKQLNFPLSAHLTAYPRHASIFDILRRKSSCNNNFLVGILKALNGKDKDDGLYKRGEGTLLGMHFLTLAKLCLTFLSTCLY